MEQQKSGEHQISVVNTNSNMINNKIGFGIVRSHRIHCISLQVSLVKKSICYRWTIFIAVCSDGRARLWSTETGEIVKEYIGHQKPATCLAFDDRNYR